MNSNLAVAGIEIGFVGDVEDLISPKLYEQRSGGAVALAEAIHITNRPSAHRTFAGHVGASTYRPKTFAL